MNSEQDQENIWRAEEVRDLASVPGLRDLWNRLQEKQTLPDVDSDIDRYLSLFGEIDEQAKPMLTVWRRGDEPETLVVGRIIKHRLSCRIGYLTLARPPLNLLIIDGGGILGPCDRKLAQALVQQWRRLLRSGQADAVLFNHLRMDTELYQYLYEKVAWPWRRPLAHAGPHFNMTVPRQIDVFYGRCSKKRRYNLRRSLRKVEETFGAEIEISTCRTESEVDDALKIGAQISRHTYQHGLGVGLVDDTATRQRLLTAAQRGWLRFSILRIRNQPCSFQLGLQYHNVYFLEQVGYDPQWAQWEVGTFLFMKILEELCQEGVANTIDFGFGDGEYKRIYGDSQTEEASVLLFGYRPYSLWVNGVYSLTSTVSEVLRSTVNRLGVGDWIKRHWRKKL